MEIPRLEFSEIGAAGDYPEWVRALRGASGSYVIAERMRGSTDAPVVYVGESHSGRLYRTLTRHFQQWKRRKTWWNATFGRLDEPGTTYDRGRCLVAVVLTPPELAIEMQWALIEALAPRDNIVGQVEDEDLEPVPF